jgi:hypothetical protein
MATAGVVSGGDALVAVTALDGWWRQRGRPKSRGAGAGDRVVAVDLDVVVNAYTPSSLAVMKGAAGKAAGSGQ